jgi:hypothetical protein
VVAEQKVAESTMGKRTENTRLAVLGDSSWITNQFRSLGANRNLVLNLFGWLTEQDDKIAIRPNTRGGNLIVLTPEQRERVAFLVWRCQHDRPKIARSAANRGYFKHRHLPSGPPEPPTTDLQ